MREKAVERRSVNKEHNSNFKAGYVPIDEDRLHKTGLRGRKGNLAICVIVLLFILAVINLIVSTITPRRFVTKRMYTHYKKIVNKILYNERSTDYLIVIIVLSTADYDFSDNKT